ncbi:hypothetical protein [Aliivibrio fischeri]|uniref:hypothetical protein n=1 Tax=Aliivibrio fischeri TaxID=668 RepID=UPI0007C5AFCF|nr:hypothetical protein [Aliivibrio fischeri]
MSNVCAFPGTPSCLLQAFESVVGFGMVGYLHVTISGLFYILTLLIGVYVVFEILMAFATGAEIGLKWFFVGCKTLVLITFVAFLVGN